MKIREFQISSFHKYFANFDPTNIALFTLPGRRLEILNNLLHPYHQLRNRISVGPEATWERQMLSPTTSKNSYNLTQSLNDAPTALNYLLR